MHQIPSYKFTVCQSNGPSGFSRLFTSGREDGILPVNRDYASVGNGNLMSIFSQILQGIPKTMEGLFNIRTPVFVIKRIAKSVPVSGILQIGTGC